MKFITQIDALNHSISDYKIHDCSIGLVPTMGALHEGHLSLLNMANRLCDVSIVSVFVNPTQFNDINDLENYPADIDRDSSLLEKRNCDILFAPNTSEVYPNGLFKNTYSLNGLDKEFEGAKRPSHFDGVCTIVHQLLKITKADKAFFGQKDFQQLAIIKELVKTMKLNVEIIAGNTIREVDGLAMSSRNKLLTDSQRKIAPIIFQSLLDAKQSFGDLEIDAILTKVKATINSQAGMTLDYVDIVHSESLRPIKTYHSKDRAHILIAVTIGTIRLIDNLALND